MGSWLSVRPDSSYTPRTLTVGVDHGGLTPGTYRGSIVLASAPGADGGQLVSVNLTVKGGVPVTATPSTLRFETTASGGAPPPQTVQATSSWPMAVAVGVSGGWLQVTPLSGTTPLSLTVTVNPVGLAPGVHNGTITITSPGAAVAPATISVAFSVGGGTPRILEVSNGAGLAHDFAPGSMITLYGKDLGPAEPQVARTSPGQPIECSVRGTRVLLNGVEAPLLYVHASQINAMIPYSLAGQSRLEVQVDCHNMLSEKMSLALSDTAPVLFTADASGRGQGAIVNEGGMLNGPFTPAGRGSVISLFGAGGGLTESGGAGSGILEVRPDQLRSPVRVWIGGVQADVLYAGPAPGMASGLLQVTVRVPFEAPPSSSAAVTVKVGEAFSQAGVTLAVK
jgi:uncharacterized protein (TIGR03437 family)